jgi:hypothetical protein
MAGEYDVARSLAAMVTSSGDRRGPSAVTTSLVGKRSVGGRGSILVE